jgi:hypothetical protein
LRQILRHGAVLQGVHLPGLGHVPVLAELAGEVAAGGAKRQHRRAGQEVVQRLFLDGIDAKAARAAVAVELDLVRFAAAHVAQAALAFAQAAGARAQVALDAAIGQAVPVAAADHGVGGGGFGHSIGLGDRPPTLDNRGQDYHLMETPSHSAFPSGGRMPRPESMP